jgi:hypothetical protein
MSEDIFAKALRNFTMDAAAGDAIRHLTDKGFTLSQVRDALTFPAPVEYIADVMWNHLIEKGIVIPYHGESAQSLSDPSPGGVPHSVWDRRSPAAAGHEIVEHRDRYGRKSFIRVQKESPEEIYSPEDYVQYENILVISSALEQVSSLSDHIPLKVRNTGSHRDT